MHFLHLADLHLGKRLNEYSLLDDQKVILQQALEAARQHQCEAVLIAGDVYDKPNPSVEAMTLFDDFLTSLSKAGIQVYMISGNHDSAGRISYFSGLLAHSGIHTSDAFQGTLQSFAAADGKVCIHLLPFIRPLDVRRLYPEEKLESYEDAVRVVLRYSPLDTSRVNILLCHQFITGGMTCDSEEFAVGGLDNISAEVFADFDYVALGHLHQAQSCGRKTVRYAGSPLKYSVSEEHQRKSFTLLHVDADAKQVDYELLDVVLPHDVRTMRGTFAGLMGSERTEDYIRVILTDEIVPPDARVLLRDVFPNMLKFSVENSKTSFEINVTAQESIEDKSPLALFADFFALQNNGVQPSEAQLQLVDRIFTELEGDDI